MNTILHMMIGGLTFTNFFVLLRNGSYGKNRIHFNDEDGYSYTITRDDTNFFTRVSVSEHCHTRTRSYDYRYYYMRPVEIFHNSKNL